MYLWRAGRQAVAARAPAAVLVPPLGRAALKAARQ